TGAVVPAGRGRVVEVAANRHIVEDLGGLVAGAELVEPWIEQAKGLAAMAARKLVRQQHDARPQWGRATRAADHLPALTASASAVPRIIDAVACQRVGIRRDIGHLARAIRKLIGDAWASLPGWPLIDDADTATTTRSLQRAFPASLAAVAAV